MTTGASVEKSTVAARRTSDSISSRRDREPLCHGLRLKGMVRKVRHVKCERPRAERIQGVERGKKRRREMNVLEVARQSGLAVLLDGRIGRQEYTSVSGSTDALLRFARVVRIISLRERERRRRRVSLGRLERREQRLSIELRLQDEIARTGRHKHRMAAHLPNTASNRIESPPRSLRPALCR
jgi:hypothetical protein